MQDRTAGTRPPVTPPVVPPDVPATGSGGGRDRELRLVATYDDRQAARRAIEALSMRGVDGGRIHLVDVDPASFDGPVPDVHRRTDIAVSGRLGIGALQGIGWGGLFGFVVVGLAMLSWRGPVVETLVVGLGGGMAGMMVGAALGLFRLPVMADAWGETSRPVHPGAATVVVVRMRVGQDPAPLRRVLEREGRSVALVDEDD